MLLTCMFALRIDLENPASSGCSTCVCAGQADLESQVLLQDQLKLSGIDLELGGGGGRERGSEQTVTVIFGSPVDREGRPVKVAQESTQMKD